MRLFLLILVLVSFLQAAFLPVNLCLIIILVRSFVVSDRGNYYLAIFTGILLGFLAGVNLGFWAVIFLLVVKITTMIRKLPIAANYWTILPYSFLIILLVSLLQRFLFSESINIYLVLIDTIL